LQIQKDKIQLYQNQVYVTDNVEGIVPEFLMMLKGGRFSRYSVERISFGLQADAAVKKNLLTTSHVCDKVAD
jgi:molecular chaperone HtpG